MSQEIDTTVDALLASYGVTYSAVYVGVEANALGGSSEMDHWKVNFTKNAYQGLHKQAHQEFDFYTGLGNRAPSDAVAKQQATWGYQGLTANDKKGLTSYGRRYLADVEKLRKPITPTAASVLHCLVLDAQAANSTFRNWCDDFGYDDDSISARNTYDACQKTADQLRRVFSHAQIAELEEALQDY
jgi:hypothetical protein